MALDFFTNGWHYPSNTKIVLLDDFTDEYAAGPVTGTSPWISTLLSSGTAATSANAVGGELVLSGAGTTDNSGAQVQWDTEPVILAANKDVAFYCRAKVSDITESHWYMGLGVTDTTFIDGADGNTALAHADSVGLWSADDVATMALVGVTGSAVGPNTGALAATLAAATYAEYEFLYKAGAVAGTGTVTVRINGIVVGQVYSAGWTQVKLAPTLALVSGTASGTISANFDLIAVACER